MVSVRDLQPTITCVSTVSMWLKLNISAYFSPYATWHNVFAGTWHTRHPLRAAHFPKCTAINWNIPYWLVVDLPLWKIWVSWDDYSLYMEKYNSCSKPPTSLSRDKRIKNCIVSFTQWYFREHYGWLYAPMFMDTPCHYHIDRNYCGCSLPLYPHLLADWNTFVGCFNPRIYSEYPHDHPI